MSEALYSKAKLLARMEGTKMTTKDVLSSQNMLARMIQKVEELVKEVRIVHESSVLVCYFAS